MIFLPLIFLRDVSGVLFRELAYVIMFSLLCSLLVAGALAGGLDGARAQDADVVTATGEVPLFGGGRPVGWIRAAF